MLSAMCAQYSLQQLSLLLVNQIINHGGVCAQRAHSRHSVHFIGRHRGILAQLAIFLPKQTILHPHNVRESHVSPQPHSPNHRLPFTFCKNLAADERSMRMQAAFICTIITLP